MSCEEGKPVTGFAFSPSSLVLAAPPIERQLACPSQISSATWYQFSESFYHLNVRVHGIQ